MYSSAYVWAKVLTHMENLLGTTVVSTWFDDAEVVELTEHKLVLYSPSEFRKDIIERRCAPHILDAMKELFDMTVELQVLTGDEVEEFKKKGKTPQFIEYNPQFTFDRFVVGPSNRFAHAAAIAVANKPAETYNPLFIYGPSGLGKTHLLYAIAGEINYRHPDYNIIYIKGDQFTNEMIQSLQEGKNAEFRNKYRNADLFLVDDIQFISGKESTQEEFFHTFNNLYENHKQIVLTSDRPPSDLLRLEDRLKTRFEWGLIADINPPDYETRMAIILNKSKSLGMDMPDDVCAYIAENITTNIRQIEGTVKKIKAYWELTGMEINVANVSRAIKDMYKGKADTLPTPSLIISEVGKFYNIDDDTLRGTLKNKGTAEARQVAMYLIRKMTNLSLPDTGKEFGRDHSTVLHSVRKIEKALSDSKNPLNETIRDIMANINSKL
ncbi:MAG TPA: chromosomal replication initiator protein DnaA [Candidatus Avoscillospira stercorigallinarum]|uniref:Chromosomal replication initiator protein DnaA n=1 Tax=Candidatus Avoscillospira stercorigallinarum TaxID=2840708 RepID=A0A9D0Z8X9_9FIRM|nr:chromosomal replication initiator protein DnaA [Candidatus Avoscillospira stercorigallinarum]